MSLAENVAHFARALRRAGVPVGPDRVLDGLRALQLSGVDKREDFYWTLASVFLSRHEQLELFDHAFRLFWRERFLLDRALDNSALATPTKHPQDAPPSRVAEALGLTKNIPIRREEQDLEPDAVLSAS